MFKRLIVGTFICLVGGLYAQTDQLNAKKYWKFRNNFRRDFVKIGSERGEGIPIASRLPIGCTNNVDASGGKGAVRWADGMLFQGHYIGFLATEYRLLKNRGQDVTATLNELYYALNAINRTDRTAEPIITGIADNGLPVLKDENLNGFYLRDDAGADTYKNWENSPINCRCTEGAAYTRNNMAGLNEGGYQNRASTNDHSTPSLDQMTSLLLGIVVINKLIEDGVYVQPTPSDPVMDIKNEALSIANRLISYAYQHNYFLLDEWGWPISNGGGELFGTAYPITLIGENLLGNDYSLTMKRQKNFYGTAQQYYSTLIEERRDSIWDTIGIVKKNQIEDYEDYANNWILDLPGLSNFEAYQLEAGAELIHTSSFEGFWTSLIPDNVPSIILEWEDNQKIDGSAGGVDFGFPVNLIKLDSPPIKEYNLTIMFNLGVASGIFDSEQVAEWGTTSANFELILIDALLKNSAPAVEGKAFFQNILNSMPLYGGFKYHGQEWYGYKVDGTDSVGPKQIIWAEEWGGEYKWIDELESNSAEGHQGQFNALDYMYLHNLYYLVYGDDIAEPFEETYDCFCGSTSIFDINALQSEVGNTDIVETNMTLDQVLDGEVTLHSNIVKQLSFLDFCTKGVFSDFTTIGTRNIKQQFDDYHDIGISLNAFLTNNHNIAETGEVNIESRLVICNTKEFKVLEGGVINLDKGEILIKPGASLVIEGDVHVAPGAKIIVESEGKIVIKNGGNLDNSGYIQLKDGATLEYEEGARFQMNDDFAEFHIDGGDLIIRENADFTFEKGGSQSGQMRFSEWGAHIIAENNTTFSLRGNGDDDPILILEKDADFWSESTGLKSISLKNGKVDLFENARLVGAQNFLAIDVHFNGIEPNRGTVFFDQTNLTASKFDEVDIFAPLFYKNAGKLIISGCEINNDSDYLVKIKGMGYNINNTTFNGAGYYMISAQNTLLSSRVSSCTFNGNETTVGIIDNSNAELDVKSNNFNSLYVGLHKLDGRANVKCNNFNDFSYAGIVAHNNCVLDVSTNGLGGYNVFTKNDAAIGTNIALWDVQSLLINNGKNTFDDLGALPIIQGSLQMVPPPGAIPVIFANVNQWNVANTVPASSRFNLTSATGGSVTLATFTPSAASCPNSDIFVSGTGYGVPNLQGEMPLIQSPHFNNVGLAAALDVCINTTEQFGGSSDLLALELFEEVLMTYPSMPSSDLTNWLVRFGAQKMKNTLQKLVTDGEINIAANSSQFSTEVQRYVNVLNALTSVNLNTTNYKQLFYLEMDKVHLFHLLGKHNLAILTLLNTESCGLNLNEQMYINHWKKELDEETKKTYYGYTAEFLDTTWIDTTYYKIPTQQNFGNFGSYIENATTIEFFNCSNYRKPIKTDDGENSVNLSVQPNPNQGIFTLTYFLPEESNGEIVVYSIDGKPVYRFTCQTGQHQQIVDISDVANGTYFYKFVVDGIGLKQGKFIIQ